jgi:hypothetical protein
MYRAVNPYFLFAVYYEIHESLVCLGLSVFALYLVQGFYGYIIVSCLYGTCLGLFLYMSKVAYLTRHPT